MSVMSSRIDDTKRKALRIIASVEGKPMGRIITDLIEGYINEKKDVLKNLSESENLREIMKMSESSFSEWDNEEDEIYNSL